MNTAFSQTRRPRRAGRGVPMVAVAIVLAACGADDSDVIVAPRDVLVLPRSSAVASDAPLDVDLEALLLSVAPRRAGLGYFKLPVGNPVGSVPEDPRNHLSRQKIELGRLLFHETALGVDNVHTLGRETYSCASCHFAQGGFQANVPQGMAEGGVGFGIAGEARVVSPYYDASSPSTIPDVLPIRAPSTLNSAYQQVMLWNGQFGSTGPNVGTEDRWIRDEDHPLSSNFLGFEGLETEAHAALAVHRMASVDVSRVADIPEYQRMVQKAFGNGAELNRLTVALAIAAYERSLVASEAPFQRWLRGEVDAMTDGEKRGAILFFGEAGCVHCHSGPALNSMTFHALGMNDLDEAVEPSRVELRPFGGTVPESARLGRGGFTGRPDDAFKFKTPQLYNLADSPFYGHGASFSSVLDVVRYFNQAVPQKDVGSQLADRFVPLGLTDDEIADLTDFLLDGLYDPDLMRYAPSRLPSGNCLPVNDPVSRVDLGCDQVVAS